jgi:ribosomal protein L37AE/L43A
MTGNPKENKSEGVRMELKYCEHCGGLFLRECGAGVVYCEKCQPKVAELPVPKKKPGRVLLPVRRKTVLEDFSFEREDDGMDFEAAAGGVACAR